MAHDPADISHKAAANNPNVSDEAKENSKQYVTPLHMHFFPSCMFPILAQHSYFAKLTFRAASNIQGGDADVGGDVQDDVADVPVDEDADYDDEAPTGEVKEEKPKNQVS